MGNAIIPPEMFGFDPDETWEFSPAIAADLPVEKRPVFILRPMDAGTWDEMESSDQRAWQAVRKACPEASATLQRVGRIPAEQRTDEDAKAFAEAVLAWEEAWVAETLKHDRIGLQRKLFAKYLIGWRNFRTRSGREIPFPADPLKIADCIPGKMRDELVSALKAGATVSDEEKASLT